jgi:chromosome segregation protein
VNSASSQDTNEVNGLSPLLHHIEIEKGYEHLIRQLLNDVYVSTGSPLDYKFQNELSADSTIVDQQALMIRRAGQLAGGSVGLFEGNRLGRKKHLEVLEKEIIDLKHAWHQLQSKVERTQTQIANLQAIDNAADLQVLRSKVVTLLQSWAEINSRTTHLTERVYEVSERRNKNVDVLQETEAAALNAVQSLQAKKNEFSSYTVSLEQSEEQYFEYQQQVNEAESQVNELRLQEIHLANKLESIERELKYHQDQAEQLSQSSESQTSQIEHDTIELEQMLTQTASMKAELIALYEDKKSKEAKLTEAEQNYYQQRHEIGVADDRLKALEKQRSNQQYLINEMKDQHNQLKYKMVAISERMQVEFGIRLEEITEEHLNQDLPFEELESKVNRLRNRLENYGEINPLAIEAHEEIKTRFDTINTQRQDILSAKTSLLATITEIEETATGKFMEAFNQVRENFVEVFRSLFTDDDTCDLVLIDPNDPLESEIDIIAKPKGKRPKSLSQLSGGEKTLTAIALLFALYLMKPAPFCVFDEVDAPLDDANIQKFNKIIKKFSAQSQFIIVTHNKSTMAAVDTIYGVYMEEQGVSGLSQVDFRSFDETDILAMQN